MATAPFNIAETTPGDSSLVSQFPAAERTFRDVVESYLNTDHDYATGNHSKLELVDLDGATPTIAAGQVGIWQEAGVLMTRTGAGDAVTLASVLSGEGIPSGTKMLFAQASAPTGWTQVTTWNDKVLRVVSGTGAVAGGSWTISGVTVDGHVLTSDEIAAHTHSAGTLAVDSGGAHTHTTAVQSNDDGGANTGVDPSSSNDPLGSIATSSSGAHGHTLSGASASAGGGASHTHGLTADGLWRPAYLDVIVAEKD